MSLFSITAASVIDDSELSELLRQDANQQRQERAAARQSLHELRSTVKKLERQIEQGSEQLKALESRLADTETYAQMPADELSELLTDAATARKNLETLEERWLNVSAELEAELT